MSRFSVNFATAVEALREELAKFAHFQEERGIDAATRRLRRRLQGRVEPVLNLTTPEKPMEFFELVALLASVRSTIHLSEPENMDGDRRRLYRAIGANIAMRLKEFYEIDNDSKDPREISDLLRDRDYGAWFKLVSKIQSQSVVHDEVHPWSILNVGGAPSLAHEAMIFEKARKAALMVYNPHKLPKEVEFGWTGANVLEDYIRTLRCAMQSKKANYEAFDAADDAYNALIDFARQRDWEIPSSPPVTERSNDREASADDSADEDDMSSETEEAPEVEERSERAAPDPMPGLALEDAVRPAAEAVGLDAETIIAAFEDFKNLDDLCKHWETASDFYAKQYGEKFAEALFAAISGGDISVEAPETDATETASAEEVEEVEDTEEVVAQNSDTDSAPAEEDEENEDTEEVTAADSAPAEQEQTQPSARMVVTAQSRQKPGQCGNDIPTALADCGFTPERVAEDTTREAALAMLGKIDEKSLPSELRDPIATSIARGRTEATVDVADAASIEAWLLDNGKVEGVGPAYAKKAAKAIAGV